jgi:hypothetical protein
MSRALSEAGFETLETATPLELDLKLRSRRVRSAPRALVVLANILSSRSRPALSALANLRVEEGLLEPQVVLTREFGSASQDMPGELGGCPVAAVLEKPFDLGVLQAIAFRCRTGAPRRGVA